MVIAVLPKEPLPGQVFDETGKVVKDDVFVAVGNAWRGRSHEGGLRIRWFEW